MEDLFNTRLSINNEERAYKVVFDREQYIFQPLEPTSGSAVFSLRREQDEWHPAEAMDEETKRQAIDALERYLMKQH